MIRILKNTILLCASLTFVACSSNPSLEEKNKKDFDASISNPAHTAKISDVNYRMMTDDETRSIYEVFTGKEFGHGRLILRSDPSNRDGLYFFIMFDTYCRDIQKGTVIKFYLQTSQSHEVQKYTYTIPQNTTLLRELVLGITGKDTSNVSEKVLAWKIEVISPEDKVITQQQSWLWSMENPSKLEK